MNEEKYILAGSRLKGAEQSQMFGKPCFKINGKAFISFFRDCMVFKLRDPEHKKALALKGAELFDPSGKKRPMKEWVQVPAEHNAKWNGFAKAAYDYVNENS